MMKRAPIVLLLTAAACAVNPVTGERELALISERQEIEMGREYSAQVEQQIGVVQDEALQQYVEAIGLEMARASERPDLPWRFRVLDDPTPNAFALPGGFIYVTRGLMSLMGSEAQLASVLGHEIGHVTARHSVSQMSRAQLAQLGLGVGMVVLGEDVQQYAGLASAGLGVLFLKYGRDDERQSDRLGFRYALDAGYDVREMADVFRSLERASELAGAGSLPTWLSSHPSPPERVEAVRERVDTVTRSLAGLRVARAEYLRQVDGLVYGKDPRAGYFTDGSTFIHPQMAFSMEFPAGWQQQNLRDQVVAASEEGDGIVQLTLADAGPAEAARTFAAQDGITAARPEPGTINGFDAVAVPFTAEGETPVRGVATFLADGDRTFQLLAYSAAGAYERYAPAFRSWTNSYARVSDPALLNVEPERIAIVELPTGSTLEGFESIYPSAIGLEELALLNQVDGPAARLEAGRLVKRVVNR
ncbi:MAG: M48 family metalloprotease [Candidatus Longimicrobiales bacterium M2_2A_002]